MGQQLDKDASISWKAVRAFHHAATYALIQRGGRPTQNEIARLAGSNTQSYSDAMRGRAPALKRVAKWMEAWHSHPELPKMELRLNQDGVIIIVDNLAHGAYGALPVL